MKKTDIFKRNEDLVRMLCLLNYLDKEPRSQEDLSKLLRKNFEQIEREIILLQNAGFPIVKDAETDKWRLVSNYGVPKIDFTPKEVLSLILLFKKYGQYMEEPLFSSTLNAVLKLASQLSPDFFEMVVRTDRIKFFNTPIDYLYQTESDIVSEEVKENSADRMSLLLKAIEEKRTIRILYQPPVESSPLQTTVNPYTLFFTRSWYLIGYSSLFHEIRTFKVNRIEECVLEETTFQLPLNFSLENYFGNAWNMIRRPGDDYEVVVRFSSKSARNVSEIKWHKTQEVHFLEDGSVELQFLISGLDEIIWWVLGYGSEAKVIKPKELQLKIQEHVHRMKETYRIKDQSPAQS